MNDSTQFPARLDRCSEAAAAMLAVAGFPLSEAELRVACAGYAAIRANADRLWIPAARDAEPATAYRLEPSSPDISDVPVDPR